MDPDQAAQGGGARKKTRRKKTSSQGDAPPPPPSATIHRSTQSLVQHTPAEAYAALQLSVGRRAVPLPQSVREARGVVMAMESFMLLTVQRADMNFNNPEVFSLLMQVSL